MNPPGASEAPSALPGAARARPFRGRVPVVLQLGTYECGAACLAMILRHFGHNADVAEVRERLESSRDGATALALARAARAYGLEVKAYSVEPPDLAALPLPAIAHFCFDHYVVVERWSPGRAEIVDPARGRRRLTADEFDAGLTGVVLTFAPGERFERRASRPPSALRAYARAYLLAAPGLLSQVLVASLVLQSLGLALPVATKLVVDRVLPGRIEGAMPLLAAGAALLFSAQAVATRLRAAVLLRLQARLDARFVPAFFERLFGLPLRFFEQRSRGDLLMRVASAEAVRDALTGQTLSFLLDGSLAAAYFALLVARDPAFGLLVSALGALEVAALAASARRTGELARERIVAQAAAQTCLLESLSAVAAVKASGAEARALQRFTRLFFKQVDASLRHGDLSSAVETATAALRVGAPLAMLWLGASRVLEGGMSAGTMLALVALGAAALAPLSSLVQSAQRLPTLATHVERLADVMRAAPEVDGARAPAPPRLAGKIELCGVGFRYANDAPWALRDVSIAVEPGQVLALVGPTGCGKTTLLKLMLGLYAPTEGHISFDGARLDSLDPRGLRAQFGVVLQEPSLCAGSIRENIAFGDASLALSRVERAAHLAAIGREIDALPMGYETMLSEGGGGLSGGQRQRLSLARALAHEPAILFLDEATSHLDVATERTIDDNLRALACTRVVIAHRLSTVRRADRIVVLDRGKIIEQGTHDELVALGGRYAAMASAGAPDA